MCVCIGVQASPVPGRGAKGLPPRRPPGSVRNMSDVPPPTPPGRRYELKKYQAGYGLLALGVVVLVVGFFLSSYEMMTVAGVLLLTGAIFQFDKERPRRRG